MWAVNLLVALAVVVASTLVRRRRQKPVVSGHRVRLGQTRLFGGVWQPRVGVVVVVTSAKLARPIVRATDETGWCTLPNLAPGEYSVTYVYPDGEPTDTKRCRVDANSGWLTPQEPTMK